MKNRNSTGPNFSPRGGVGSIWKDPNTGETWKYTKTGWIKGGSGSIQEDVESQGTFTVKPDEEDLVSKLKAGGSSEDQVKKGLEERRRILSNIGQTSSEQEAVVEQDTSDPFGGMSKIDLLKDAFNKGVRDVDELEKLGGLYDLFATEDSEVSGDVSGEGLQVAQENLRTTIASKAQALTTKEEREAVLGTLSTFSTGQDIVNMLDQGQVSTGPLKGRLRRGVFGIGGRAFGKTKPEEDYFNALTETFAANYRKAMSGTAVSVPEMQRLEQFLPSEMKSEQDNIQGILALSDYLSKRNSLVVNTDMSLLKPRKVDSDPLKVMNGGVSENNPLGI